MSPSTQLLEQGQTLSFDEAMHLTLAQFDEELKEMPSGSEAVAGWSPEDIALARELLEWIEAIVNARSLYYDGIFAMQEESHIALTLQEQPNYRIALIGRALDQHDYSILSM